MRLSSAIILCLMLLSSCGYRGDESDFDDVFQGVWNVDEINCRVDEISPAIETYRIQTPIQIFQIQFNGRNLLYSTQVDSPFACQMNVTGTVVTNYEYTDAGTISFYEVSSHTPCTVELDEINSAVTDVAIPFGVNEASSRDLEWEYDDGKLEIRLPFVFKGSSGGPCGSNCICSYELTKN